MTIYYSPQAKQDLTKIDWKLRSKIISEISLIDSKPTILKKLPEPDLYKIDYENHIIISELKETELNIITVLQKRKFRYPGQ